MEDRSHLRLAVPLPRGLWLYSFDNFTMCMISCFCRDYERINDLWKDYPEVRLQRDGIYWSIVLRHSLLGGEYEWKRKNVKWMQRNLYSRSDRWSFGIHFLKGMRLREKVMWNECKGICIQEIIFICSGDLFSKDGNNLDHSMLLC